jgi:hypothetical protein
MIVEFIVPFPITRRNCDSGNGEKMTCISAPTELQYLKLKTPKEPFPPGAAFLPHLVEKGSLTTYLTTPSAGTPGNSGFKTAKEYLESSGKQRKPPQTTTKNLLQPFRSRRLLVRIVLYRTSSRKIYSPSKPADGFYFAHLPQPLDGQTLATGVSFPLHPK